LGGRPGELWRRVGGADGVIKLTHTLEKLLRAIDEAIRLRHASSATGREGSE